MILGNRLRKCRKEKKKTQVDLAKELGLNRSTYAKYETGDNEPDNETIQRLADYFEVSIDYLLGRTDDPSPTINKEEAYDFEKDPNLPPEFKEFIRMLKSLPEEDQIRFYESARVIAAGIRAERKAKEGSGEE